jgi:hypothetical protein
MEIFNSYQYDRPLPPSHAAQTEKNRPHFPPIGLIFPPRKPVEPVGRESAAPPPLAGAELGTKKTPYFPLPILTKN